MADKDDKKQINEGRIGRGISPKRVIPPKPKLSPSPQKKINK